MTWFRSTSLNSAPPVREKLRRLLTISLARKVCLTMLVGQLMARVVRRQRLGQHLHVVGDHREGRIHFVRHAGGEQAKRSQLLVLQELLFELHALGDVVDQDQPAHALA